MKVQSELMKKNLIKNKNKRSSIAYDAQESKAVNDQHDV